MLKERVQRCSKVAFRPKLLLLRCKISKWNVLRAIRLTKVLIWIGIGYTKVNLRMENILNAEADTQDKGCYSDKAERLKISYLLLPKVCASEGVVV
ncbi:Uncharacterised protein [Orientia tsutsugamushi]|uniref:Uncharacterized protein n=1 Tax=Orientia tsutsugamushi TaxID=784 RepID=A0A2U3RT24_ORITS|nr:hypothetical protein OTSKARP_1421 [Orientia tsutsugamushi str. Karp]SPR16351.1 Uncharacterised protein [Orientia tsutsugamushi]